MSTSLARCRLEFILVLILAWISVLLRSFAPMLGQYPAFLGTCRFVPSRKGGGQLLARLITARAQKSQVDHSHCFQPTELSTTDCNSSPTAVPLLRKQQSPHSFRLCHGAHSDSLIFLTSFLFRAKQHLKHRLHAQPNLQHFLLRNIRRPSPCCMDFTLHSQMDSNN